MPFVTNNSDVELIDGFAGIKYTFAPGKTIEVPAEVVRHVFGYQAENKEPYLARLGWIKTKNDLPSGIERLSKFVISEDAPKENRSLSPAVERVPLPPKGARGKSMPMMQ